jgi:hypothetical protein
MATGRVPTTANSPLTAKGDLFGYSTTQARVAVGNDGETLVADSSTSTGLRYQVPVNVNPVLNSSFQIWQRGTSILALNSTSAYQADRWQGFATSGNITVSRQATNDTTNLPNIQYCARSQRTAGNSSVGGFGLTQNFETINSIAYAGKTVTVSFYARAGANYSAASNILSFTLGTGTGTDQNLQGGYTGYAVSINQNATLTTTWQRFSYTATLPTTLTEFALSFGYTPVGTAGANDYFELTGVQLEFGSVATPFKTYAGTIQGELAACSRYYQKSYNQAVAPGSNSSIGTKGFQTTANVATSHVIGSVNFGTTMRTTPTVTIYGQSGGSGKVSNGDGTDLAANSGNPIWIGETGFAVQNGSGGSITPTYNALQCHYVASAEL